MLIYFKIILDSLPAADNWLNYANVNAYIHINLFVVKIEYNSTVVHSLDSKRALYSFCQNTNLIAFYVAYKTFREN